MRWSLSRLCQDHMGCVVKKAGNSTEWIMGSLGLYKASTAPAAHRKLPKGVPDQRQTVLT